MHTPPSPILLKNLVGGSTPRQKREVHTMTTSSILFDKKKKVLNQLNNIIVLISTVSLDGSFLKNYKINNSLQSWHVQILWGLFIYFWCQAKNHIHLKLQVWSTFTLFLHEPQWTCNILSMVLSGVYFGQQITQRILRFRFKKHLKK